MNAPTNKTPWNLWLLSALALAGVGVSIALTQHYYDVRSGMASFHSFCNMGRSLNCDAVAASRYSEVAWNLPLSSFSGGWFLSLFVISLMAANPFARREGVRAALALSGFATLMSVVYFGVMAVQLRTYCLLCLVTDALSVLALLTTLSLKPERFTEHKLDVKRWKLFAGITLGALALNVAGMAAFFSQTSTPSDDAASIERIFSAPVVAVGAGEEFPSIGPKNAPITIVEFSDFQCPFCRMGAFVMNSLLNQYPDKLRIVFRNFPLDPSCNRFVPRGMHEYACEAAKASLCARRQDKFQAAYEELFEGQKDFAPGKIPTLLQSAGVDITGLPACVASPEIQNEITFDVEEGNRLGVQSTPTFFLNGHKVEGVFPMSVWTQVIDRVLAQH